MHLILPPGDVEVNDVGHIEAHELIVAALEMLHDHTQSLSQTVEEFESDIGQLYSRGVLVLQATDPIPNGYTGLIARLPGA
jgi:hypothetical protein